MEQGERPSKTQRKKAMHELQSLGERLVELSDDQLSRIDLPEGLRDAVREATRTRSHEGRRRQMQYIGRLMRDVDPEPIREQLAVWDGQSRAHVAREHEATHWRERLLEDEAALGELAAAHPGIDLQRLRTLVRGAKAERDANRPPKNYRELFRLIRDSLAPTRDTNDQ